MTAVRPVWLAAFVVSTLAVLPPLAGAQGVDAPPGCDRDPEWCDPAAANGGRVKTGDEPVRVILYAHVEDLL